MALMRRDEVTNPGTAPSTAGQTHTILGPEASFDGKLTFSGAVRIDGKFSGEIETDDVLVVGEGAEVEATLLVGSLVLNGLVRGNVKAKKSVELMTPARLYGDIDTPSLVIHNGVIFEGSCKMEGGGSGGGKPTLLVDNDKKGESKAKDKDGEKKDGEKKDA